MGQGDGTGVGRRHGEDRRPTTLASAGTCAALYRGAGSRSGIGGLREKLLDMAIQICFVSLHTLVNVIIKNKLEGVSRM